MPSWIDSKDQEKFRIFQSVVQSKENFSSPAWKEWYKSHESEDHIPSETALTAFQQCLLTNACRPDRLTNTLTNFVQKTLQLENLSGLEINMKVLAE